MNSIGLWSADYTQLTGQAVVTRRVVHHQPQFSWREYVYSGRGWRSVVSWAAAASRLWWDIALNRVNTLYIVGSRSNAGFLRDVPAFLAAWVGVRLVVHIHGSDIIDLLLHRKISPLARALYGRCEIIVPSQHLEEPLRKITDAKIHLCENFVPGASDIAIARSPHNSETLLVLWNSNIMASKGFFDLVIAVGRVRSEGLSVQLVSVGQVLGDEEMTEREAARRLDGLLEHEWIEHLGKVEPVVVADLVAEADVVALPSRYSSECQPLAIIQAMCAGRAIIVADTPALRATSCGYPAHFVSVHSAEDVEVALRELYRAKRQDPAAFASAHEAAATVAQARFAAERFDREVEAILLGLP